MGRVILDKLSKSFPAAGKRNVFHSVREIDLDVCDGEFMVIVGPSGCGKSTTLRMIAGLEEVTSGTITIDGIPVHSLPPKDRGIAMVFQNYALYPHMNVFDNMAFGLKLAGTPGAEIRARVAEAARILGLESVLDRKPAALSGGQRQRVAVGRAIVRKPKVFLFDEPLSNLDAKMRHQMRTEICKLHAKLGSTVIYVTHDQVEAMTMGDRICVMQEGRIMQIADPLTLYNHPSNAYVAGFIGSPPMNLIHGTIKAGPAGPCFMERCVEPQANMPLVTFNLVGPLGSEYVGQDVILGLRPESIKLEGREGSVSAATTVELSEPMGAESHLHLRTASGVIIARIPPGHIFRTEEVLTVYFDPSAAHFFDSSEQAIISPAPSDELHGAQSDRPIR